MSKPAPDARYYQLALLWPKDRPKFSRYLELVAPVVRPYGAGLERQFLPTTIYAQGMERPDVINLVYYDSRAAYQAFAGDPKFKSIVHLRTESVEMASVEGCSERAGPADGDSAQLLCLIELARFGEGGEEAYRAYEIVAEPIMERYGYSVDRVLRPDSCSGLPFHPDVVKVASFASADHMQRMQGDPNHAHIEHVLYPAAVAESIWIVGSAAPRTAA